ncbi:MAG: sterol desaturase family protein [Gammaproteobacteria bacterium]|nr:sterol desaturase family protein [Gammaproteobacteria bacterium]
MYLFEKALLIAIPAFSLLIFMEYLYGHWKGNDAYANKADGISSLLSGLSSIISNVVGIGVLMVSYEWLHGHVAIFELSSSHWWVWVLAIICWDFSSYWVHRWAHENGFLWANHVIHHSSEHFNLAVALRQQTFKWVSYQPLLMLPVALLGVPVEVVALTSTVMLFMAYWYHTPHIRKFTGIWSWLEYIIVTPSQHRVHHAINDIYIDKNYAGIFCVWDRWFGTFQEELDDEPCVYGCLGPVRTWDPMKIELRYIGNMLRDAIFTKNWGDKIRVFTAHTGWRPADVAERWPGPYISDYKNFERYRPTVPAWLEWWGFTELLSIAAAALYLFATIETIAPNPWLLFSFVAIALLSISSLAALLEGRAGWLPAIGRVALMAYVVIETGSLFGLPSPAFAAVIAYVALSLGIRLQRQLAISSGQPAVNTQINATV